jgi:uncharacterized phiE125 gp8 family phage protein
MLTNVSKSVSEPPFEIISLSKAKKQLRIEQEFNDENELIQTYIDAAISATENYINGDLHTKTLTLILDEFQPSIIFEAYPVRSITSVKYWQDDTEVTMPDTDYYVTKQNIKQSQLTFKEQPKTDDRHDAVTVAVATGYAKAKDVPKPLIQAILLQISDMYERREDRPETITTAAQALMRPYRRYT